MPLKLKAEPKSQTSKDLTTLGLADVDLKTFRASDLVNHWRKLMTEVNFHPDRGGDHDLFIDARQAYERLYAKLIKMDEANCKVAIFCASCGGTGKVYKTHGFGATPMRCKSCHGTGKQQL